MDTIFIQIASYRDPELVPTISDSLQKAKYPDRLRYGICWQHANEDVWDNLDAYKPDSRFTIMDVHWKDSKGLGWARHRTQKMWKGETYTLQIDSHHRFIQDWDEELITMFHQTGVKKPIITSYAAPYTPGQPLSDTTPYKIVGTTFSSYGTILFYPHAIPNASALTKPIPGRFVSGHFYFTLGQHCQEYKYDPEIYFAGDEISLSIRSFTLGYDIFYPHKVVLWHEYIRAKSKKHWDDFDSNSKRSGKTEDAWHELDEKSKSRLRQMLREEDNNLDLGVYTLGSVRTHSDYERYAGISFKHRKLHPDTMAGINPPLNQTPEQWLQGVQTYTLPLRLPPSQGTFEYIYIGIESKEGKELHKEQVKTYQPILTVTFTTNEIPYKWIYWPSRGTKTEIILGETSESLWETYSSPIERHETMMQCSIDHVVSLQNQCVPLQNKLFTSIYYK